MTLTPQIESVKFFGFDWACLKTERSFLSNPSQSQKSVSGLLYIFPRNIRRTPDFDIYDAGTIRLSIAKMSSVLSDLLLFTISSTKLNSFWPVIALVYTSFHSQASQLKIQNTKNPMHST